MPRNPMLSRLVIIFHAEIVSLEPQKSHGTIWPVEHIWYSKPMVNNWLKPTMKACIFCRKQEFSYLGVSCHRVYPAKCNMSLNDMMLSWELIFWRFNQRNSMNAFQQEILTISGFHTKKVHMDQIWLMLFTSHRGYNLRVAFPQLECGYNNKPSPKSP